MLGILLTYLVRIDSTKKTHNVSYEAVKDVFQYINATWTDSIYFWRKNHCNDLPELPLPASAYHPYTVDPISQPDDPNCIDGIIDSDWGGESCWCYD